MNVLSAEQFSPEELTPLFSQATEFRETDRTIKSRREIAELHTQRIMLSMFYEPSTRTRFSFEIAAHKLGMDVVVTENAAEFSSAAKGETIEDTVMVFNEYGIDAISLRTKEEGHANRAAAVTKVPIFNGGDGKGEHPTQAALDVYTIYEQLGQLDNLTVVMGGDLAYGRTVRSLSKLLAKYNGNRIIFVSIPELRIGEDIKAHLDENGTKFEETEDLYEALSVANVAYWTRAQLERHEKPAEDEEVQLQQVPPVDVNKYIIDDKALAVLPRDSIIMHPLPRTGELPPSTDGDPRAVYFRQAGNGLYLRMAMLDTAIKDLP